MRRHVWLPIPRLTPRAFMGGVSGGMKLLPLVHLHLSVHLDSTAAEAAAVVMKLHVRMIGQQRHRHARIRDPL